MAQSIFITTLLQAKAAVERAEGDVLSKYWALGDVVTQAPEGTTLQSMADAIGMTKGTLSKASTLRQAFDRPTAVTGTTLTEAYNNAREILGHVSAPKAAPKFNAEKAVAKFDKRQRRAIFALLAAEFGA